MRILIAVLLLSFCSCISQKKCAEKYPPQVITKDSVVEREVITYKDTTITVPGDSVRITDTIPCPGVVYNKKVTSSSGRTTAAVSINKGKLQVDCKTDSFQHRIDSLETVIREKEKYHSQVITVEKPVVKYRAPAWMWWYVLISVVVLLIVFRSPLGKAYQWVKKILPFVIISLFLFSCYVFIAQKVCAVMIMYQ